MTKESERSRSYWSANLKIVSWLMVFWFLCSFGFGIIFSDTLDQFRVGGFKLGFWFAQQGSIYIFIVLVFVYVHLMNKLDKAFSEAKEKD